MAQSTLHPLVQRAIARAQTAGAQLDLARDWAGVAKLNALALAITAPRLDARLAQLQAPVCVGDLTLRRLSLGAEEWIGERKEWFATPRLDYLVTIYLMSHTRTRDYLRWSTEAEAVRALLRWARGVRAERESVRAAAQSLMPAPRDATPTQDGEDEGCGPVVGLLVREYGHTIDYWLWEVPSETCRYLIECDWMPRVRAEIESARRSDPKSAPPNPDDYQVRAQWRFNQASKEWIEKVSKQAVTPKAGKAGAAASPSLDHAQDVHAQGGAGGKCQPGQGAQQKPDECGPGAGREELPEAGDDERCRGNAVQVTRDSSGGGHRGIG